MNYEHAMLQAGQGFRVTRKEWVNKNVTTSDGNDFKPVVTELEAGKKGESETKVSSYSASDEDKAADDWSVL